MKIDEKTAIAVAITLCCLLFCFVIWNIIETTKPLPEIIDEEEEKHRIKFNNDNKTNEFNANSFQDLVAERNDKIILGNTNKYRWSQSESSDIEVYIPLINNELINYNDITIKSKNIKIIITSYTLSITILDELYLKGKFYAEVIPDECNWQIDNDSDSQICLTIVKRVPTVRNQHWDCLIQGDDKIDTSKLGPQVHHIDTNNKGSISESIAKVILIYLLLLLYIILNLILFYYF
jgi:hypothetical protein